MKKIISVILLMSIFTATGCNNTIGINADQTTSPGSVATAAGADYNKYFQGDKVIDIKITLPQEDYQDMLDNAKDEKYKSADITVDGTTVTNVGFRTKGNLTLNSVVNSDSDRYSFRVKLDKYVEGQSLDGLDEFVLNNMYSDASYMREFLSYEALKYIGVDTPQCVFANIYINDELKGLYLCVEAIDDSYIERVFGSTDNCNLYKAEMGSSLVYKANDSYDSLELKIGNDTEKTGLKNMIESLNAIENGDKGTIENLLDVDSALKYIAFNYVFSNYDSYLGNNQQNYYLYENNGKFSVIPWDYNMSFGGMGKGQQGTSINMPISAEKQDNFPLVTKLLSVEEYKNRYYSYVQELLDYCSILENRIYNLKELIYDDVNADPTKFCTIEDFEKATTYSEDESTQENNKFGKSYKSEELQLGLDNANNNMPAPPQASDNSNSNTPAPPQASDNSNSNMPAPPQIHHVRGQDQSNRQNKQNNPPTDLKNNEAGNVRKGKIQNNTSSIVNFTRKQLESIAKELAK